MQMNKRRIFTNEFKTEAVRRVQEDGHRVAAVARELGIPRQLMRAWLKRAMEIAGESPASKLNEDERDELLRLRQEVLRLKTEKDILKKAAAFFAKESL
jgi:transposase